MLICLCIILCVVSVVLIYSNNCAIWILLTTNNCGGLFGSFTPSVKAKVKVVAASYCGTGTGGTTLGLSVCQCENLVCQ